MNGSRALASELVPQVVKSLPSAPGHVQAVLCPPATLLSEVGAMLRDTPVALGGQDCHAQVHGAFTGDISAEMLKEVGCRYVILGHSERREYHAETNAQVVAKAAAVLAEGLTPVICVGETLALREMGEAEPFVANQTLASLPEQVGEGVVIAYEPIWAIGTGHTPTAENITSMHHAIAKALRTERGLEAPHVRILYGGSVKASNAKEILDLPGVDGVLVGGGSLIAAEFSAIVGAA